MKDSACIFCSIVSGQIPSLKVFENDSVLAFLDINPISDGHTLVIPKAHYARLHECPAETLAEVAKVLNKLAIAVVQAVGANDYNVLCNNGPSSGQVVEHVHFHIIPRKAGDGVFNRWPAYQYPDGKAAQIVQKILKNVPF